MTQVSTIKLTSISYSQRKAAKTFFVCFLILMVPVAVAGFICWQHFNHFKRRPAQAIAGHAAPAIVKPVTSEAKVGNHPAVAVAKSEQPVTASSSTVKLLPVASVSKTDDHAASPKSEQSFVAKAEGFANSVITTIMPTAKTATTSATMPSASSKPGQTALPAKRMELQPAVVPAYKPPVLTAAQKRLAVAQDGFD